MELKYHAEEDDLFYRAYLGDALDMNEIIDKGSIDLVVTSPPYNIGKEYEEVTDLDDYLDFMHQWMAQAETRLTDDGSFWLNIGFRKESDGRQYVPWEYEIYPIIKEDLDISLVQQVIWHYKAGVNCRHRFSPRKETWLYCVADLDDYTFNLDDVRVPAKYPNQKKDGELKVNPKGKNPGDVWDIPKVTSGKGRAPPERTDHPAQYPEDVVERIIKVSTNPGDVIFDPFLGSGTTMKVARDLGRSCIGVEIQEEYMDDIIQERVFTDYSAPTDAADGQMSLDELS
jgi:adenine-specific DNA-methyltransferase